MWIKAKQRYFPFCYDKHGLILPILPEKDIFYILSYNIFFDKENIFRIKTKELFRLKTYDSNRCTKLYLICG